MEQLEPKIPKKDHQALMMAAGMLREDCLTLSSKKDYAIKEYQRKGSKVFLHCEQGKYYINWKFTDKLGSAVGDDLVKFPQGQTPISLANALLVQA